MKISDADKKKVCESLSDLLRKHSQRNRLKEEVPATHGQGWSLDKCNDIERLSRIAFLAAKGMLLIDRFDAMDLCDQEWLDLGDRIIMILSQKNCV